MHKLNKAEYDTRKTAKETAKIAKEVTKGKPNTTASLKERLDALETILGV